MCGPIDSGMTTVHDYTATLPEDSIESPYGNIL